MFEVASRHIYEFGEFRLDTTRRLLLKNEGPVQLTHKAFETLALLVENSGRIVEKDELLSKIWPDTFVEEGSLARNISVLRKTLGEQPGEHQYIQTIPKQGYRFVAPVRETFEPVDELSFEPNILNGTPKGAHESASVDSGASDPQRATIKWAIVGGVLAALLVTAIAFYFSTGPAPSPDPATAAMNVTRFTTSGKALDAAISLDGKYVVYVQIDGGRQSLWVKQVASGSNVQIIGPADVHYQGLAFTTDGDYIFYNVWDKQHVGAIFRIPVLGGPPTKVVNDVMPTMSVSPDNSELVFVRSVSATSESLIVAAKTDGSGERVIARRGANLPGWFGGPVWSPDGKYIAYARGDIGDQGQSFVQVAQISADGSDGERLVSEKRFLGIGALAWLKDGKSLIVTASEQIQKPFQLWRMELASGEARRISNDVNGYNGISITSDSRTIVTTQGDYQSNIYLGDQNGKDWKRLTSGRYEGMHLTWSPDGRIVYVSLESGNEDIWIMNVDGTGKRRLTTDPSVDAWPAPTSDGKSILFVSLRAGVPHIFRMNYEGGDITQLTNGPGEWGVTASPTQPFAIFHRSTDKGIWRMNIDGSDAARLTDRYSYMPTVSPDGTRVAFNFWDDSSQPEALRQSVLDLRTGQQTVLPALPKTAVRQNSEVLLRWAPDGRSIAFVDDREGVSNIWRQSVDGGPPQRVTDFNDSYIFGFDWSSDGRIIAARGTINYDVVLITGFDE